MGIVEKALNIIGKALDSKNCNHNAFIVSLTSCSHAGLGNEGLGYFKCMSLNSGMSQT